MIAFLELIVIFVPKPLLYDNIHIHKAYYKGPDMQHHTTTLIFQGFPFTSLCQKSIQLAFMLFCLMLLASCGNGEGGTKGEGAAKETATAGNTKTTGQETVEHLLKVYAGQERSEQVATANKIFALLNHEELTDSLIKASNSTPKDSLNMHVL